MRLIAAVLMLAPFAVAADDLAARTLKVWDANADGVLTKEEFPDEATFKKADRDGDGKVTVDEIAIFLGIKKPPPPAKKKEEAKPAKKAPARPKGESTSDGGMRKAPFTISERVKDFFRRFDANMDKLVDKKEAQGIGDDLWKRFDRNKDEAFSSREASRLIRYQITEAKKRPNRANFFELFDRNRDKRVTKPEYDGPAQFFRQYDHDRNKVVTEEEINMGPNARARNNRQMQADKKFMADGPTRAPKRTLLDRYDKDQDGRITLEELNGAEALMQRLDTNGDGILSGREAK